MYVYTGQALVQDLRGQVVQVQEDVVLVRTHAATYMLHCHICKPHS